MGIHGAWAQDESAIPEDEYAVLAPLAKETLLIDAVQVDGAIVAVGTRGIVLISEDKGESWTQAVVPTRAMLTGVYFHDRNLGWAVGHDSVILKTEDGGQNWRRVHFAPDLEMPLFDVWFSNADNGFAVGAYGLFLETSDGGETWTERVLELTDLVADEPVPEEDAEAEDDYGWEEEPAADFHMNKIAVTEDGWLYIAAESGQVYRSDDQGATWLRLNTEYLGSLFGALPIPGDRLLVFGLRGAMLRSADDGVTWQQVETPVEISLNEGVVLDDGTIVVVGMSGTILVSDDGGDSFYLVQRDDRKALMQALPGSAAVLLFGEAGAVRLDPDAYRRP